MSYNLLSGSIEFIGTQLGEVEDIVNVHTGQNITGPKTFTNITASGGNTIGLVVGGALELSTELHHSGDTDTKLHFPNNDELTLVAGNVTHLFADSASGQKKLVLNPNGADVDLQLKDSSNNSHLLFDSAQKVFTFGNSAQPDDSVFVHVTGAVANASLLSVGNRKDPVLAVSGAVQKADWKVKVQGLLSTSANIEAGGTITGSLGIKGELLNVGNGLEHLALAGEKKLSAKVSTTSNYLGLGVGTEGIRLDTTGLTEEGSLNTDTAQPDYVIVADNDGAGSYTNKKLKVSTLLSDTLSTVANIGTGAGIYSTVLNREIKLRAIKGDSKLLQTSVVGSSVEVKPLSNPAIHALTSSNTMLSGSTRNEYAVTNITSHGQNVSLAFPLARYQVFNAQGNAYDATASLPQITNDNVGMIYNIKFLSTKNCLITGSAGHDDFVDGSKGGVSMTGGNVGAAKFKELLAVDMTGGGSYEWVIIGEN